jgi:hypothetical protein
VDRVVEVLEAPRVEAQLGHVELERFLVEDAEHGLLAEDRGQDRHAEVDLLASVPQLDPSVLRQPPLGDVQVGHDLETGDDRGLQALGRRQHLLEHAVHPKADAQLLLVGLPVQVGGTTPDGVQQDHVHQLHHRCLVGRLLQLEDVPDDRVLVGDDLEGRIGGELGQQIGNRGWRAAVVTLDGTADRLAGGDHGKHGQARHRRDLVHRDDVGGIGHRQGQAVLEAGQRQHVVLARDVHGDQGQHLGGDRVLLDRHRGQAVFLREHLDQLLFADEAALGEHLAEPLLRATMLAHRRVQLIRGDQPLGQEDLAEPPAAADKPAPSAAGGDHLRLVQSRRRRHNETGPCRRRRHRTR